MKEQKEKRRYKAKWDLHYSIDNAKTFLYTSREGKYLEFKYTNKWSWSLKESIPKFNKISGILSIKEQTIFNEEHIGKMADIAEHILSRIRLP